MASPQRIREPSKRPRIRSMRLQESEENPRTRTSRMRNRGFEGSSSRAEERGKGPAEEEVPVENSFMPYFTDENLSMEFTMYGASKELVPPRFVKLSWLRAFNGFIADELERQGLTMLLEMTGLYYPNLIRAFFTAVTRDSRTENLEATLKGTQVVISDDIWLETIGLKDTGFVANKASLLNRGMPFNKIEMYRSLMKNPTDRIEGSRLSVKPLKLEFRVLHYILTWIILPRGSNHAQIFEDDLIILWAIQRRWKINWVRMIKDTILKAKKLNDSALPYAILISKFLLRFNVSIEEEGYDNIKPESELQNRHIKQMGYEKVNGNWIEKRRGAGTSGENVQDQEPPTVLGEDEEFAAGFESAERPWSTFEQQVLDRLDHLSTGQTEIRQQHAQLLQGQEDLRAYMHRMSDRLDAWGVPRNED